ncbi:prepilin peptidase [Candidatus Woesearchaeota archaeon]|nr:prepilin peptidase [Candidatus Woesearchaeota archaeon]
MWQIILMVVTLTFLVVASYVDLKKREVPDWTSYGLIFSALGLRFIFSFDAGWAIFLNGLLGFAVCFGLAYLFYYVNLWGGGDSKLLMGMGAVIGLGWNFEKFSLVSFDFNLLWFFLSLLFFGAVVGLFWSLSIALKERSKFFNEFKRLLGLTRRIRLLVLLISVGFFMLSLFYYHAWPFIFFPIGGFYTFCFVKAVEKSCFIKEYSVGQLVEGDWLAEDVVWKGKKIAGMGKGLEKKEIWNLMSLHGEGKLKSVLVKEGIPFVPSFLLAYLVVIFKAEIWQWLAGFLG